MALSKRQRAKVFRGVQYGIGLVVVLVLAVTADWAKIRATFFDVEVAKAMFPEVITVGLKNTVIYTALGFSVGLVVGLVLALMRLSSIRVYRWVAGAYIEFFRGLPALLIILAIGTGVPIAFPGTFFDKYTALAIALGIVASAYMAETFRAGIQAVPAGQVEAARSLGLSAGRTTTFVVVPQAFKIILPPLTNELIMLTKDSSLALFLGSTVLEYELTQFGRVALNQYRSLTPVVVAGFCYLIITIPLGYLSRYLERSTGGKKISTPESPTVEAKA
ncbi:MAG TPA: amino acid ABC transporter permease [Actinophytocola sp.]|uniref:amino acid ABC transporter permease n=1 Tax=Actinophytocola sp. TaxID=1872138 RepID=UPI002DBC4ADD|nr:amino acid ABC transporter permease [Actinophytocola sp.]HEU5473032.1 amino acid ABC transporter permease [Actinophytocola sp.]